MSIPRPPRTPREPAREVSDGHVTLRGEVESTYQRELVELGAHVGGFVFGYVRSPPGVSGSEVVRAATVAPVGM